MNYDKINKLLALAERGIDGEAANAKAMLKKVLAKHGYTIQQYCEILLPDEQLTFYKFSWRTKHEKRLLLSVAMSLDLADNIYVKRSGNSYEFELTEVVAIELDYLYTIYRAELNKEIEALVLAFVCKNDLGERNPTTPEKSNLSKADKDLHKRALIHHKNMSPVKIRKALD